MRIFLFILILFSFLACKKEVDKDNANNSEASESVVPLEKTVNDNSGSFDIKVNTNSSWKAVNIPEWISITPESGNGSATIKVNYKKNCGGSRTTNIQITINQSSEHKFSVKITQNGIIINKSNLLQALNFITKQLKGTVDNDNDSNQDEYISYIYMIEMCTDNSQHTGLNSDWEQIAKHNISPSNKIITDIWNRSYDIIDNCNKIIKITPLATDLTSDEANAIIGEAKTIKGFILMNLVKLFGNVPSEPLSSENATPKQDLANEIEKNIILLFDEAQNLLPSIGSFTKKIPQALQARLLWQIFYRNQSTNLNYIISQYSKIASISGILSSNYDNIFSGTSNEVIWQLDYSNTEKNLLGYYAFESVNGGIKEYTARKGLIDLFDENDARKISTYIVSGNQYLINKYRNPTTGNWSLPIIRYAEILLIKAEFAVRNINSLDPYSFINQIRNRAGLVNLNTNLNALQLLDEISKQRRLELAFEGQRWYDLVSYELNTSTIYSIFNSLGIPFQANRDVLFPIPQSAINKNFNLIQNPNY